MKKKTFGRLDGRGERGTFEVEHENRWLYNIFGDVRFTDGALSNRCFNLRGGERFLELPPRIQPLQHSGRAQVLKKKTFEKT